MRISWGSCIDYVGGRLVLLADGRCWLVRYRRSLLFASTTADSCEVPSCVTVVTGGAECWALLSTALVVCGSASRAGAAWWVLLLCWERISEMLDGGLITGVVCDFRTPALGCFLCSTFGYGGLKSQLRFLQQVFYGVSV